MEGIPWIQSDGVNPWIRMQPRVELRPDLPAVEGDVEARRSKRREIDDVGIGRVDGHRACVVAVELDPAAPSVGALVEPSVPAHCTQVHDVRVARREDHLGHAESVRQPARDLLPGISAIQGPEKMSIESLLSGILEPGAGEEDVGQAGMDRQDVDPCIGQSDVLWRPISAAIGGLVNALLPHFGTVNPGIEDIGGAGHDDEILVPESLE